MNSKRRMPQPMIGTYLSWSLSTILMLPAPWADRAATSVNSRISSHVVDRQASIVDAPCQMYHQSASTWWFAMMIAGRVTSVGSSPLRSSSIISTRAPCSRHARENSRDAQLGLGEAGRGHVHPERLDAGSVHTCEATVSAAVSQQMATSAVLTHPMIRR